MQHFYYVQGFDLRNVSIYFGPSDTPN